MDGRDRRRYGRWFGLPDQQIRLFDELTVQERKDVERIFGLPSAERYVYAVKRAGGLVCRRCRMGGR